MGRREELLKMAPQPPWHMWGTSERIESGPADPLSFVSVNNQQLARISYKRPERWAFFFAGEIIANDTGAGGDQLVELLFDIIPGIGRSQYDSQQNKALLDPTDPGRHAFCRLLWNLPPGQNGTAREKKWTTQVPTPLLNDNTPTFFNVCDWFPAQDCQCRVSLRHTKSDLTQTVTVVAHAYFAPAVHVRPDWFRESDALAFRGGEVSGS